MKMSEQGINALIAREGCVLTAYKDTQGVWTIGVGHTSMAGNPIVTPGMKITQAEAEAVLAKDLVKYEQVIEKALRVPVEQNEFDALVSICFNVGPRFADSTCIRKLNNKDRAGAASAIMLWSKPPEIVGRRRSEQRQFLTPYKSTVVRPVPAPAPKPAAEPARSWLSVLLSIFKRK